MISAVESGPTVSPARAMLLGGAAPAAVVAVLTAAVGALGGAGSAASVLVGAVLAMAALGAGPVLLVLVRDWSPPAVMAVALVAWVLAVLALAVAYLLLSPLPWVLGSWVAAGIIGTGLAWVAGQLRATSRLRILAFGTDPQGAERLSGSDL